MSWIPLEPIKKMLSSGMELYAVVAVSGFSEDRLRKLMAEL